MLKFIFPLLLLLICNLFASERVSLQLKWKNSFQFAGFYMAKEKGFYKDVGLDVTFKELNNNTNLVKTVVDGNATYGVGDSALIYYRLKGKPVVLMMPILKNSPLALLTTKDVHSLADFKSDKILINKFSLKSPAILSMLHVSNINMDKLQPKTGVFSIKEMQKQKLDLYAVYATNQPYYLKKHHIKYHLFSPANYGLDFYGDMLFTSQHEVNKHFNRTIHFMDASKKGWEYAMTHIDETIKVIQQKYNSQHYSRDELLYQAHAYQKLVTKSYTFNKQKIETTTVIFKLLDKIQTNIHYNDFVLNRFVATKSERDFLKTHTIRCISTTNWAPFNLLKNGHVIGLGIDYWDIVADKLHINNSCNKVNSFSKLLNAIKSKKADLTVSTSETPERKEYAIFSKSYVTFPIVVATKRGSGFTPDINAIKNKTFALVKNHTATKLLLEKVPNLHYIQTNTLEEALKLVDSSKAYATVEILPVLAYAINKKHFNTLVISGKTALEFPVKFMIRKDYKELLPMVNRVIASIDASTRKKIYNKWVSVNMRNGYSKHQVNRLILLGATALFLFILWIVLLLFQIKKRKKAEVALEKLANYDALTSIYNRHKIDTFLIEQMEISKRYEKPLSIIFFDIDKFKTINDTYGHEIGDSVLKELTALVSQKIRESDSLGRWGGEEFLIVLPETNLQNAIFLAEKLRKAIEKYDFSEVKQVTCSFGVSEINREDSLDSAISKVDKMLYIAKEQGRNKVVSDVKN